MLQEGGEGVILFVTANTTNEQFRISKALRIGFISLNWVALKKAV